MTSRRVGFETYSKEGSRVSPEENKQIVRRCYELFNGGRLDEFDELMAADVVDHSPTPEQSAGLEGVKESMAQFRKGFPDARIQVEDLIAEGDFVADRTTTTGTHNGDFAGSAPTGKSFTITAIDMYRIQGEKIVEIWHIEDTLGMMRQLGLAPAGR
jgi:steroid delta-isomerase-like uncharacterized protein